MEELLLQLFLAVGELLLEALLEFAGEATIDLVSRAVSRVFTTALNENPVLTAVGYAILGG
jgi:hypothetical protein